MCPKIYSIVLSLSLLSACSIDLDFHTDSIKAYETYMNKTLPDSVYDFQGYADSLDMNLWTRAHFTYKAKIDYFHQLQKHTDFHIDSEFNIPLVNLGCDYYDFDTSYEYWTDKEIVRKGKECYKAIYFPTVHYLIYDPDTLVVEHFVTGMRS